MTSFTKGRIALEIEMDGFQPNATVNSLKRFSGKLRLELE
jgi:hypothetical protein